MSEESFFKYKNLVFIAMKRIHYPIKLREDLISAGYLAILEVLDKFEGKNDSIIIPKYIAYILKLKLIRVVEKYYSYWPYIKNDIDMVGYNTDIINNTTTTACQNHSVNFSLFTRDIENALNVLTIKQKEVIKLRYGLFNNNTHTYKNIAELFGCSIAAVHSMEKRALYKLNKKCKILKIYL